MSAIIRPLTEADLPAARRIARTAFGTFLGAPDPENFWADRDLVYGRFAAEHVASFAAELDGELVGSNFVTKWGSVGFFGPLTVHPDQQGRGIAKSLVEAVAALLDACGALAQAVGMPSVLAGVNMAREEAYRHMVARGFRSELQGVTMHRPNAPGYSRAGIYLLDDWR